MLQDIVDNDSNAIVAGTVVANSPNVNALKTRILQQNYHEDENNKKV